MKFIIKRDNMLPHQLAWWDLQTYIKLLVGGFGCGKTYIGALRMLYSSYVNRGLPIQYISPSYKMLKKTILLTMREILDRNEIPYEHNKTDHEIVIPTWDGRLWFGSGDNPDSLRGPNLAAAYIDEPFIQDKMVFDIMMSRVRHPQSVLREIGLTGTPEQLNWGYDVAMNDENKYDVGVVTGDTRDNTHLPEAYVQSLLSGYTQQMVDAYVAGKFVNLSAGLVYRDFNRDDHVYRGDPNYSPNLPIKLTFDFNVNPMHAALLHQHHGQVWQFDEIVIPTSNTSEVCAEFLRRYGTHKNGVHVYGDASGKARTTKSRHTDYDIIRDELQHLPGFRVNVPRSNPSIRDRVNTVSARLKTNDGTVSYRVHEDCKVTIRSFEQTQYKEGTSDVDKGLNVEHMTDAIGYYFHYEFPLRKSTAYARKI